MNLFTKFILIFILSLSYLNAATILVVREKNPEYIQVLEGFKEEIGEDYQIVDYVINAKVKYKSFLQQIKKVQPDLLLVMDEQAVQFSQKLNSINTVAVMGLNFHTSLKDSKYLCGIAYETAPYSIVSEFQEVTGKNIKKVSIFYRSKYNQQFISDAKRQLSRSNIIVNAINLDSVANNKKKLKKKLKKYLKKQLKKSAKNDAIVVLGDNVLLERSLFAGVWLPAAAKSKVPFLSGIKVLGSEKLNFCAFTASPDHMALGSQAAQFVYNILDEGMTPQEIGIVYASEIETNVNQKKFKKLRLKQN
ncbi:hypothetical protein MJH12_16825 [bacterium]|nr:hypothetical protein [bacterium]